MTLTSVEFGSGFPASGDNIPNYTGLKVPVMAGQITGANNLVQSQTTIRVNVSSANAPITFQVNEIGIFAQIGAATPILFAYASTGGPTGDTVTPSAPSSAIIKDYALLILFTQNVPSATNVTLQQVVGLHAVSHILPGGIDPLPTATPASDGLAPLTPNDATQVLLGGSVAAWGAVPVVTSTKKGGLPLTPGDTSQVALGGVTGSWGPVPLASLTKPGGTLALTGPRTDSWRGDGTWQPSVLIITSNITLFVATTGNDLTAVPNNPALPWLTIQGALNYLIPYFIEPGVTVTVSVGPGIFPLNSRISVNHPSGSQIQIIGTLGTLHNISSAGSIGGTPSAYAVPLTVTGTMDIVANDWVLLDGLISGNQLVLNSFLKVSSVSGQIVTVSIPYNSGLASIAISNVGTMTKLKTILSQTANVDVMDIVSGGLGLLSNIGILGNASTAISITAANQVTINTVGINNAIGGSVGGGILVSLGNHVLTNVKVSQCGAGISTQFSGSNITASDCGGHYGSLYGFNASSGSSQNLINCWAVNNITGLQCAYKSDMLLSTLVESLFNATGIAVSYDSLVVLTQGATAFSTANALDLSVTGLGIILRGSGNSLSYSTASQAVNVLTVNGLIAP